MNLEKARQDFAKIQKNISSIDYAIDLLIFDAKVGDLSVICRCFVYRKIRNGECQPGKE